MNRSLFAGRTFSPAVWAAYVVMLMIPEVLVLNTSHWWDPYVSLPFCLLFYSVLTWALCALCSLLGRRAGGCMPCSRRCLPPMW